MPFLRPLRALALSFGLLTLGASGASAQVVSSVQGTLTAVDTVNRTITVDGVLVHVPTGTDPVFGYPVTVCSPSKCGLTLAQLAAAPAFPGRVPLGFLEAQAEVVGTFDLTVFPPTMEAISVQVGPGEAGIVGVVTSGACSNATCSAAADSLLVNGARVARFVDTGARIAAATTVRYFPANLTGAQTTNFLAPKFIGGVEAMVEGYFGAVAVSPPTPAIRLFHYHRLDLLGSSSLLANPTTREVSVERLQGRERDGATVCELDGRGFVHTPNNGSVSIYRGNQNAPSTPLGSVIATPDGGDLFYGAWRWDAEIDGACPGTVTVRFGTAFKTYALDLRIDLP
jgi:hypothetical protein